MREAVVHDRGEVRVLRDDHEVALHAGDRIPGEVRRVGHVRPAGGIDVVAGARVAQAAGGLRRRVVRELEGGPAAGAVVEVRPVAVDVVVGRVAVGARVDAGAIRSGDEHHVLVCHCHGIGIGLDVVPTVAERRPGVHGREDVPVVVVRGSAPVAVAHLVRRDVDLVARGAMHLIPRYDRGIGLVPVGARVLVDARIVLVVAHVQVLDAGRRDRWDVVERLLEHGPDVPHACVVVGIDRAHAPVIRVVLEDLRRRERGRDRRAVAADLRADREVRGGVDLDLVARGARDRVPGELRIVDLGRRIEVGHGRGGHRRPDPVEVRDRAGNAPVSLGVDRDDAPVVHPGCERRGDCGRGGGDVRRPVRVVLVVVAEDDRRERLVGRDGDEVLGRARNARPAEHHRIGREGQRLTVAGRLLGGRQVPELRERADVTPPGDGAVDGDRADAPVVGAVRRRLGQRRARVLSEEVVLAATEDATVHPSVHGDLELVLVRVGDGRPGESRHELERRAVGGRRLVRRVDRAASRPCGEHGDCGESGCEKFAVGHQVCERGPAAGSRGHFAALKSQSGLGREDLSLLRGRFSVFRCEGRAGAAARPRREPRATAGSPAPRPPRTRGSQRGRSLRRAGGSARAAASELAA